MSTAGAESREQHRASDSLLVRIAEKPLVVAALFLFTAIFPWVVYFLIPILARASVLDLLQWLSLPLIFLFVNGVLIFQWLNQSTGTSPTSVGELEEYQFVKRPSIEVVPPEVKQEDHEPKPEDHEPKPESEPNFSSSVLSSYSSDSESEIGDDNHAKVAEVHVEDHPPKTVTSRELPPRKLGHRKSESLNLSVELPELVDFQEKKTPSPPMKRKVTRRNSSPKSKTPRPSSQGLVDGSSTQHHVTRRNSSPKTSMTPTGASPMKLEKERSATLHGETSCKPPLRSAREPLPLDKDDLNDRIDKFLTNFKIKRQESNLRAALTSIEQ